MKFVKNNWLIIVMFFLVLLAALISYFAFQIYTNNFSSLLPEGNEQLKRANWGAFGDYFGGILNPFLAFFGLIMLLATLIQTQKELNLTRKELQKPSEALKTQAITQKVQRFEGTFFQLLSLHQNIVESIDLYNTKSKQTTNGRDCFKPFYKRFEKIFVETVGSRVDPFFIINSHTRKATDLLNELDQEVLTSQLNNIDSIKDAYDQFYIDNQAEIGHYFRSMYNIIKFINNSNSEDKRLYTNLLRAQLSVYELLLLFYNCLSDLGEKRFKPLVEEYALLKSLPNKLLLDKSHRRFYSDTAFK